MVVRAIDYNKCNNCGLCYRICPTDVYAMFDKKVYIAHQADCMSCYLCAHECPVKAIKIDGKRGRAIPYPY